MELAQICTAYSPYCCANIEDVNFSNISAVGTDRCFNIFAKNGAFVRDLTFENIRATSRAVNNIVCEDGSIENLVFKNLKLTFSDKAPLSAMRPASKEFRGENMILCNGAKNITFDGVTLCGSLENVDKSTEMKNCEGIAVKDCNF
jgi:hypothetical protein